MKAMTHCKPISEQTVRWLSIAYYKAINKYGEQLDGIGLYCTAPRHPDAEITFHVGVNLDRIGSDGRHLGILENVIETKASNLDAALQLLADEIDKQLAPIGGTVFDAASEARERESKRREEDAGSAFVQAMRAAMLNIRNSDGEFRVYGTPYRKRYTK